MGNLTVTCKCSVYPHIKAGIHTLKIKITARLSQKFCFVQPARIFIRDIGRIERDRKPHIDILVAVISMVLPTGWNRYTVPSPLIYMPADIRYVRALSLTGNACKHFCLTGKIMKFPVSGKTVSATLSVFILWLAAASRLLRPHM